MKNCQKDVIFMKLNVEKRVTRHNYLRFLQISNVFQFKIHKNAYVEVDPSWNFESSPKKLENFNRLYIILDGEGYIQNQQEQVHLTPGHIYLIPSHLNYQFTCPKYMKKFFVHFSATLWDAFDVFEETDHILVMDNQLDFDFSRFDSSEPVSYVYLLQSKLLIEQIVLDFLNLESQKFEQFYNIRYKYEKLYHYVKENLSNSLTIEKIAQNTNLPLSTLQNQFPEETGKTVKKYIRDCLIEEAYKMVIYKNETTEKIAEALGFCDGYYFSAWFKRNVGYSPKYIRELYGIYDKNKSAPSETI